jgi:uncharacterized protein YebE (UPF0316 family)
LLECLDNAVTDAIACLGFGIGLAAKAVVGVAIEALAAFANIVLNVIDDFKSQLPFKADDKVVVLEAVFLF